MWGQSCSMTGCGGGDWSPAVSRGLLLLGTERDLPPPPLCGGLPRPLGRIGKAVRRPVKALVAAADGEQCVKGLAARRAPDLWGLFGSSFWCTGRGLGCAGGV